MYGAMNAWSYEFVSARTHDARSVWLLSLIASSTETPERSCGRKARLRRVLRPIATADVELSVLRQADEKDLTLAQG